MVIVFGWSGGGPNFREIYLLGEREHHELELFPRFTKWLLAGLIDRLRRSGGAGNGDRQIKPLAAKGKYEKAKYYYESVRREIDRENDLTFKRLNAFLVSQWFLVASLAGVIAAAIGSIDGVTVPLPTLVLVSLFVAMISILGIFLSFLSYRGIESACKSLQFAKDQWVAFNRINGGLDGGKLYPSEFPQPTKRANVHSWDGSTSEDGERRLEIDELISGKFYDRISHNRRFWGSTDEGYEFAIAAPLLMYRFWQLILISFLLVIISLSLSGYVQWSDKKSRFTIEVVVRPPQGSVAQIR